MRDVLIIANFTQAPGEQGNGRFHYIAKNINQKNARVEVVTSSFLHDNKRQRRITAEQLNSVSYKFTMVFEPGYKKNISFKRIYSHYIFAKNFAKYLQKRAKPDVIYCAVPSLDIGVIAAKYSKENNVEFIIDVQDLWPEAFKMAFNIPVISEILFYPMKKKADFIYSSANNIITVSETYSKRVLMANNKLEKSHSVFLGTELSYFDKIAKENKSPENPKGEIWIVYVGTLGNSYDIKIVIDALKILNKRGYTNMKFIVIGDGPLKGEFESYAKLRGINAKFTGRLEYSKMIGILKECHIAVNPIKSNSAASIINKHADYAAAGLPVLNTQESSEYKELIDCYGAGFNCENNNSEDLADKLLHLYKDRRLRILMGMNNRRLAEERFDRFKTYSEILVLLNGDNGG